MLKKHTRQHPKVVNQFLFKKLFTLLVFSSLCSLLFAEDTPDFSNTFFKDKIILYKQMVKSSMLPYLATQKEQISTLAEQPIAENPPPANLIRSYIQRNNDSYFFSYNPDPTCSGDWEADWNKYHCPDGFQIEEYDDGSMLMHGTIVNPFDNCDSWDIHIRLHNKRTWAEWSALGRMFYEAAGGGNCSANHTEWHYYEIDETVSQWTGTPGSCNDSKTLNVLHAPSDFSKGVQVGFGANNCGGGCSCQTLDIRGWMDMTGDLNITCADFGLSIGGYETTSACNIFNGGFEEDMDYWYTDYTTGVSITNDAYVGNKTINLSGDDVSIHQSWLRAKPGYSYSASAWAKVTGLPDNALLSIRFFDKDQNQLSNTNASALTTSWSNLTVGGIAPSNAYFINISLYKSGSNSSVFFDEVCLEVLPSFNRGSCAGLLNPGFETDISTNWTVFGTVSQTTDNVVGTYAALLGGGTDGGISQQIAVTAGQNYLLSAYFKEAGTINWAGMSVTWFNSSFGTISSVDLSNFSSTYENYDLSLKAPPNAVNASITITKYGTGELSIDEICWQEIIPPTTEICGTNYVTDGFENNNSLSFNTSLFGISARNLGTDVFTAQGIAEWSFANTSNSNNINYLFNDSNNLVNNPEGQIFAGIVNSDDCLRSNVEIESDSCYQVNFKVALYNGGNTGNAEVRIDLINDNGGNSYLDIIKDTTITAGTNLANLEWMEINWEISVNYNSSVVFFSAANIPANGVLFIDDISITGCCDAVEICYNGIDDDGDGLTDCADLDCDVPSILSLTPNNPDNCPQLDNGQIVITASGNNLQYSIDSGATYQTDNIFTNLIAGDYNIRVRNMATGCYEDALNNPLVITNSNCPEICDNNLDDDGDGLTDCADPDCEANNTISVVLTSPTNCPQLDNGQISITATGDNLQYSIDNGATYQPSNIFPNLSAGNYFVRVQNNIGCSIDYPNNPVIIEGSILPTANNLNLTYCPGFKIKASVATANLNLENEIYGLTTNPINGTVSLEDNGVFIYIGNEIACNTDAFTYSVCNTISSCCAEATVFLNFTDTIKPTLENIPLDEVYSCDELIPSPPKILAVDNCPQIALDVKEESTQGEDGCSLYDYELTRTWTAYDICGNSTSASQVIDIQDVTAPDIYRIYTLPNGSKMVAGVMEFVNHNWKLVNLPINFTTTPIIFHQVITTNDAAPLISQIRSVSEAQFELRISEAENEDNVHQREYVAWIAFEPSTSNAGDLLEVDELLLSDASTNLNFQASFTTAPALFLGSQSLLETDPFTIQQTGLTASGVTVNLQEETSLNAETMHVEEKVGYLALDKTGDFKETNGDVIGEVGNVTLNHNWTTVNLNHSYANPVIIFSNLKQEDTNPATVRLKNVNAQSFEVRVEEWAYLDGTHGNETLDYLVVEGSIPLASPSFCDDGTDSLEIGKDFIAIDNCDNSVVINYSENVSFAGAQKNIQRNWQAVDECGNGTNYTQEITCEGVSLKLKSILQGAMLGNNNDGLMRDDLRKKDLLPIKEPYGDMLSFIHVGLGGKEVLDTNLLIENGPNGIVDWVFVELRAAHDRKEVVSTLSALMQCDGNVISATGDSLLHFLNVPIGDYYVSIRHRNHIGLVTLNTQIFATNIVPFVDFTFNFTPVGGVNPSIEIDDLETLWSGDLNGDGKVIYQGPRNDIFHMFLNVLQNDGNQDFLPNYISRGYTNDDFNLDGSVIYQGPNNDRANMLFNTILRHPDNPNKFSNFIIYVNSEGGD